VATTTTANRSDHVGSELDERVLEPIISRVVAFVDERLWNCETGWTMLAFRVFVCMFITLLVMISDPLGYLATSFLPKEVVSLCGGLLVFLSLFLVICAFPPESEEYKQRAISPPRPPIAANQSTLPPTG